MMPHFTSMVIVGVGEERRTAHRTGPLSGRIGWRHELWLDISGRAKRCVIKGRQVFLHGTAGRCRVARLVPIRTGDRTLLVGVGRYQAGLDDTLEHLAEDAAVAEPLIAGA